MKPIILLIDDEPIPRIVLETLFPEYEFLIMRSGSDGLATLRVSSVDMVWVDYNMPEMNGIEVVTEIRSKDIHIPIIMISGSPEIRSRAINAGVNAFLAKDVDLPEKIKEAVHNFGEIELSKKVPHLK